MRLLVIAMVDSVHTSRWLAQLRGTDWDVHLFPSTAAQIPHPDLSNVTAYGYGRRPPALRGDVRWRSMSLARGRLGRLGSRLGANPQPVAALMNAVRRLQPDVVHSMEMQAAGYLTLAARKTLPSFPPWLVSVWGSDVFLFGRLAAHRDRVHEVLGNCDAYHSECDRDLVLGREFGFTGLETPVVPAGGAFDIAHFGTLRSQTVPSLRREIAVKSYQGWAGRALVALRAIELVAPLLKDYRITFYLVSPEVSLAAELLAQRTGLNIELQQARWSHDDMLRMHARSRISIGLSISDGISASMLEAMAMGSLPIQSDTGSGCEWVRDGETALLVHPESPEDVAAALRRALTDDAFVDRAALLNWETCRKRLDDRIVRPRVVEMYREVANLETTRSGAPREVRPIRRGTQTRDLLAIARYRWPWPLVNHGKRFMLFWMPKCGCTTLTTWFFETLGLDAEVRDQLPPDLGAKAHAYRDLVWFPKERFRKPAKLRSVYRKRNYTKIVVVRNPYRRLVSSYFVAMGSSNVMVDLVSRGLAFGGDPSRMTFRGFVAALARVDLDQCDAHVRRQITNDCWRPEVGVDEIIRLENLAAGLGVFSERLGLPPVQGALYARKKRPLGTKDSERNYADVAYSEIVEESLDSEVFGHPSDEQFYDDDVVKTARDLYRDDFRVLGYEDSPDWPSRTRQDESD